MTRPLELLAAAVTLVALLLGGWAVVASARLARARGRLEETAAGMPPDLVADLEHRELEDITDASEAKRDQVRYVADIADIDDRSEALSDLLNNRNLIAP